MSLGTRWQRSLLWHALVHAGAKNRICKESSCFIEEQASLARKIRLKNLLKRLTEGGGAN